MKQSILILLVAASFLCLGFYLRPIIAPGAVPEGKSAIKRVTGVGGIFFKSPHPKELKEWYKLHLGFDTDPYGARFEWQEGCDSSRRDAIQWSVMKETGSYFAPSRKDFMINYRVDNLTALVPLLRQEGVLILDTMETYEYGKFLHVMDPDSNKIELYEPNYAYHFSKAAN